MQTKGPQMSTPTPLPWIADGYELRQKHGRMIAYFGPHHTPADEYPMSCRLQDEANCQWVATLPAALASEREKVRVLREALAALLGDEWRMSCDWGPALEREPITEAARAALAATKEEIK